MHDRNSSGRNYHNQSRDRAPGNGRSHSGPPPQHRSPRIEQWINERTVIRNHSTDGRHPLSLDAVIERPQFFNGEKGFCRLMTTITVGDYHVRLPVRSLRTLIDWLEYEKENIYDAIEETYELNEEHHAQLDQQPQRERSRTRRGPPSNRRRESSAPRKAETPRERSSRART